MWSFISNGKRARVMLVNDQYRLSVYELWQDRFGRLAHDGRLLAEEYHATLAEAKKLAFTLLNGLKGEDT